MRNHVAGVLMVAKRDRLARDVVLAAMAEQLVARPGARVVSADGEGPAEALMRTMIDAFAQYERAPIRQRTKAALAVKKARGLRTGGVPYGMQLAAGGKTLELCEAERAVLAQVRAWRAAGLSLRAVVAECERAGFLSRAAKPFIQTQIVRMLEAA